MKTALKSTRVLIDGHLVSRTLVFEVGKIIGIESHDLSVDAAQCDDVGELVVMPALVDTHVHVNEPGRTDWEGFETATQAAAVGGIGTVIDMPLNCLPVTTSLTAYQEKLSHLDGKLWVDCGFHGGVVPGNTAELEPMIAAGVRSFKAFLIDSGIEEFAFAGREDLDLAMPVLAKAGVTLLAHAELDLGAPEPLVGKRESYEEFLTSRPKSWENKAIEMLIELSAKHQCAVHVVHLSSAEALKQISEARKRGVQITVETCPHYLCLAAEEIPDGDGRFKCCPPIRELSNQAALWRGIENQEIDFIVSDHSPCTPALKNLASRNLKDAWGGISSLQFGLPLLWTEFSKRGLSIGRLSQMVSENPAKLVGLADRKGKLQVGYDADCVVWDPDKLITIEKSEIRHKHKETPYEHRQCQGRVFGTIVQGYKIYWDGRLSDQPRGEQL